LWSAKLFFGPTASAQYKAFLAVLDAHIADFLVAVDEPLYLWEIREPHRTFRLGVRPTSTLYPDEPASGNVFIIGLDED
jgi:hypothetical protein